MRGSIAGSACLGAIALAWRRYAGVDARSIFRITVSSDGASEESLPGIALDGERKEAVGGNSIWPSGCTIHCDRNGLGG